MGGEECGSDNADKVSRRLFDAERITAFAVGNPSEAFGERYRMFDPGEQRKIARLPGPPYQFLDRITLDRKMRAVEVGGGRQ